MEIDYKARVLKGAALLDEKKPGWVDQIDLETLDVQSSSRCVTAQLSGHHDFTVGRAQLGLSIDTYASYGFNAPSEEPRRRTAYVTLNQLWRDLITERRSASEASHDCDALGHLRCGDHRST
ncbi:hypothetical protein ACWC0A_30420 [Streptomyces scopuliridis]